MRQPDSHTVLMLKHQKDKYNTNGTPFPNGLTADQLTTQFPHEMTAEQLNFQRRTDDNTQDTCQKPINQTPVQYKCTSIS